MVVRVPYNSGFINSDISETSKGRPSFKFTVLWGENGLDDEGLSQSLVICV